MPKLRAETKKLRAAKLLKDYSATGFNQSALARKEGVSQPAIYNRLKKSFVQQTLAEYLQRSFNRKYIKTKFKDGLEADKVVGYLNNKIEGTQKVSDEFVEVPDLHCRHKYLVTLLECQGLLKHNGNGKGNGHTTIIVSIGNQVGLLTKTQTEHLSHQRS